MQTMSNSLTEHIQSVIQICQIWNGANSRTFEETLTSNSQIFPEPTLISRTFQALEKGIKIPELSRTFQESWEPCSFQLQKPFPVQYLERYIKHQGKPLYTRPIMFDNHIGGSTSVAGVEGGNGNSHHPTTMDAEIRVARIPTGEMRYQQPHIMLFTMFNLRVVCQW